MENSKLIKALKALNKKELRRFSEFVNSPFFNKNENIIILMRELADHYPNFDNSKLSEKYLFKILFPDVDYDYYKLRNLFSELFQLYKNYLTIIAYEKTGIEKEINLLSELHDRKQDVVYQQVDKFITAKLNESKIKDEYYFFLCHRLNSINTSHYKFDKSKYTFDAIQTEFDSFLEFSLAGLLQHYSKMLHNKKHGNINYDMKMFKQVLDYTKDLDFENSPSCKIYKQIIRLESSNNVEDYKELIRLKNKYRDSISREDLYYVYLVANMFSVERLRLGDESYYKDRFEALRGVIDEQFFGSDILYPNFISTFTSACMAGNEKWALNFMAEYQDGIFPAEEKVNTLNYCEAFLAYIKKDYDKALELFSKTVFKLYLFKLMVKSYMLRIYYEKGLHEQTLNAVDAFRHYLRTEKLVSGDQKKTHTEFLKNITALSTLKLNTNDKDFDTERMALKKQISAMKNNSLGIKNWLMSKLEELN